MGAPWGGHGCRTASHRWDRPFHGTIALSSDPHALALVWSAALASPRVPFCWSPFDVGSLSSHGVVSGRRRRVQRVERQDHDLPRLRSTIHVYGRRASVLPGAGIYRTAALFQLPCRTEGPAGR